MRTIKTIMLICFVCALSSIIYYYPTIEYATGMAQFNGGAKYFSDFLMENGNFLQGGDVETFGVFSNTIYGQTETPLSIIYGFVKDIILFYPQNNINWNYSVISYFFAALSLSLAVSLFYTSNKKSFTDYLIISLFTILGTPYVVGNVMGNAGIGWTLIILCIYMCLKKDSKKRLLLIIIFTALPLIYFTPGAMLLLIMVSIFLYYAFVLKDYNDYSHLTLLYLTIWFAANIYYSIGRFSGLVDLFFVDIPLLFKNGFIQTTAGAGGSEAIPYLISTSSSNKIQLLVNSIAVAFPVLYFVLLGHKFFEKSDSSLHIVWGFILSLVPLTILLYLWLGIWGVMRLSEWGSIISFVTLASMLSKIPHLHKKFFIIIVIVSVLTSTVAYINSENRPTTYLTFEEKYSADWLLKNIQLNKSVFTDFRIAGYFVGNHHLRVMGVNDIDQPPLNRTIKLIDSIYYSSNGNNAKLALEEIRLKNNNQKMNYLLFSDQFTKMIPGIKLYDYAFKPAPKNFTEKYDKTNFTFHIYDNGKSYIYYVRN